jgi:Mlc titration factor MtfA (ptsG expression regulator)
MISEEEIREWWERKIDNYIKNYAQKNTLSFAQAQEKFFSKPHEKFLESIPQAFEKFLKNYS